MTLGRLLSALALVAVVVLAWRIRPSPPPAAPAPTVAPSTLAAPTPQDTRPSTTAAATEEAYPPPRPPSATEVPTPALGEDGYYRALPDLFTRTEWMGESPYADFLEQLQAELDAGDAAALMRRVGDRHELLIAAAGTIEGGNVFSSSEGDERLLRALFEDGTQPRIQGYAEWIDGSPCLDVFVAPWGDRG